MIIPIILLIQVPFHKRDHHILGWVFVAKAQILKISTLFLFWKLLIFFEEKKGKKREEKTIKKEGTAEGLSIVSNR
jgi:hypothetical protein